MFTVFAIGDNTITTIPSALPDRASCWSVGSTLRIGNSETRIIYIKEATPGTAIIKLSESKSADSLRSE